MYVIRRIAKGFRSEVGFAPIQTAPENPKSKRNRPYPLLKDAT